MIIDLEWLDKILRLIEIWDGCSQMTNLIQSEGNQTFLEDWMILKNENGFEKILKIRKKKPSGLCLLVCVRIRPVFAWSISPIRAESVVVSCVPNYRFAERWIVDILKWPIYTLSAVERAWSACPLLGSRVH